MNRWLFPRLHAARRENHRLHEIIAYQNGRMRVMAAERLAASAERRDASALLLAGRVEAAKVRLPVCRTIIRDGGS